MHEAAFAWVETNASTDLPVKVLEVGGRDVGGRWGGSIRKLFPAATYVVLDVVDGVDVDVVADAATWEPDGVYDVVAAVEVFEHAWAWPAICAMAKRALRSGGLLVATMAGPGRSPHGATGEPHPASGEWYANVSPADLTNVLQGQGWKDIIVDHTGFDVRVVATA